MSFNGSGTFNINTAGQPVVTGTVISSSVFNALTADLATGLSTCITKDGQTTVTANIPMNSFKFTGLAAGTAATDSVRLGQLQAGAATLITVTGTNTYAGTMTPALSAYAAGNTFSFLVPNTNTTSCTLNIDGLGAKSITRDGTTALVAGDLVANSEVVVVYDGTQFQVLNSNSKTNFNLSGTLTVAGNTTLSGGTANGVAYLNGSKVLTTGSALTFDGTSFACTTGSITARGDAGGVGYYLGTSATAIRYNVNSDCYIDYSFGGSTGGLRFRRGAAVAETMILDSSGNVGIGTSSPGYKLQVSSGATAATSYFSSTATPSYSATAYNGGNARASFVGGSASGATTGINFSQGGSFEAYFGGVQESGGAAAFVWQGYSGAAYAERMRLDSSGNLGLGVTPSAWSTGKAFQFGVYGVAYDNNVGFVTIGSNFYYNAGDKYKATDVASKYVQGAGTHAWYTAPSGTADTAISFTQAMTLDSSGNLLLGTTTASFNSSNSTFFYQPTGYWVVNHANGTSTGTRYIGFGYNTGEIGSITQSGTTGVLYNITSDYRLKEFVAPVTNAGERIDALNPVEFDWKSDGSRARGFFAHEFQQVYANSVTGEKDGVDADGNPVYQTMQASTAEVIADLVAEIKSLRQRVAQLEVK